MSNGLMINCIHILACADKLSNGMKISAKQQCLFFLLDAYRLMAAKLVSAQHHHRCEQLLEA